MRSNKMRVDSMVEAEGGDDIHPDGSLCTHLFAGQVGKKAHLSALEAPLSAVLARHFR